MIATSYGAAVTGYEVVLLRHGETVGYAADLGLTTLGEEQARERGAALAAELAPGTVVRMPHARTARAVATAEALRKELLAAAVGVEIGELYPEPWFDNLRFSLDGESADAQVAVAARLALQGELPDWARELDRFDTEFGEQARAGGPIGWWVHTPALFFEPPQVGAHRIWQGVATAADGDDGDRPLVVLAATHSAPMRAFAATALGRDPGEPANLEDIRVRVDPGGRAAVTFRGETVTMQCPPPLPPWLDAAWLASFGR